jgi:hypothetical protein
MVLGRVLPDETRHRLLGPGHECMRQSAKAGERERKQLLLTKTIPPGVPSMHTLGPIYSGSYTWLLHYP